MCLSLKKLFTIFLLLSVALLFSTNEILGDNLLPELEIDENENSQQVIETLFEVISTDWSGGKAREFIERNNSEIEQLKSEFESKTTRAEKRLLELRHLIECEPDFAPYFSSFYFRQIVDLRNSFREIIDALESYRIKLENERSEIANSLLMVKDFKIRSPEMKWQKSWIVKNVQPMINAYDIWLSEINTMLSDSNEFMEKITEVFKKEESKIQRNYRKYYYYQFDYFGSHRGTGYKYQLKRIRDSFITWKYVSLNVIKVILPNRSFVSILLCILAITVIIFFSIGYRYKSNKVFRHYLRPYILCASGVYFVISVFILPSTNDIIIFTMAGTLLSFGMVDLAWKSRSHLSETYGPNPFFAIIPIFTITDILLSLLLPVQLLLTFLFLISIIELIWICYIFRKYKYSVTEKVFGGLIPGLAWFTSGIAAWLGYLYPSMLIAIATGIIVCILYSGSVITHILVEYVGKISQRQLLKSFVFTLMIPIIWLALIVGALSWTGQIFNASRILQIIYNADLVPNVSININLKTILFLILLCLIVKFFLNWIKHMLEIFSGSKRFDSGSLSSAFQIFQYIVWCIFIIYTLNTLNIDWESVKYVVGGLSVGFGFALKDILENFVCGLILLVGKEVRPGDIVEFDGTFGIVDKINIRATFIKTYDNAIITLPNISVVSKDFRNWTLNSHVIRKQMDISVKYGSDVQKVIELLLQAAKECSLLMHVKTPEVFFVDFSDNALVFRLRFWINVNDITKAPSDLRIRIDKLFRENSISIPFPQLDVHFDQEAKQSVS